MIGKQFLGSNFKCHAWHAILDTKLEEILDLWQAGYSNQVIMSVLDLPHLLDKAFIFDKLIICMQCKGRGHNSKNFMDISFERYNSTPLNPQGMHATSSSGLWCKKRLAHGHTHSGCLVGLRCKICGLLGHLS